MLGLHLKGGLFKSAQLIKDLQTHWFLNVSFKNALIVISPVICTAFSAYAEFLIDWLIVIISWTMNSILNMASAILLISLYLFYISGLVFIYYWTTKRLKLLYV